MYKFGFQGQATLQVENECILTLKMATALFAETLYTFENSTRIIA
jgi:hypothetical protein